MIEVRVNCAPWLLHQLADLVDQRRFDVQPRWAIFRDTENGRRYFNGKFTHGFPCDTDQKIRAVTYQSAAHAYKCGSEHRWLFSWRVGRV